LSLTKKHTEFIKKTASQLGFAQCGISKSRVLEEEADHLESWLSQGMNGTMQYMENHFDKRLDPSKLVSGAKSVISLIYNYYPKKNLAVEGEFKLAKYAYGKDYHDVIKKKLKNFLSRVQDEVGEVHGRAFVDSAPVMERQWASLSGLGWLGKNSLLLNKRLGSFFFLAELIIDLDLIADEPVTDHCGSCTRCIEACPTNAIPANGVVDASKCISYFTIELKNEIPDEFKGKLNDWIFGCDICQDVCPWNRFSMVHQEPDFEPSEDLISMTRQDWLELTEEVFQRRFPHSPLQRTGIKGMKRNIAFQKWSGSSSG